MKYCNMRSISSLLLAVLITLTGYTSAFAQNPILVISGEKSFGPYTGEMLKTEGFSEYQLEPLAGDKITAAFLQSFDVVILAADSLTGQQSSTLTNYVHEGGNLIAFRPDNKLNVVFGITAATGTLDTGYLAINTLTDIGRGLTSHSLQLHVSANQYTLQDGQQIASLYSNAVNATQHPAVVMNNYGKGHGIAFAYNLPQNIAYTRQGNLHSAGKEMDGITGIRAMDLFTNGWVDTTKNTINQADEQMRLLSHSIEVMSAAKKPLPRFWYFPDTLQCLVTLNNDGEDTKEAQFTKQFQDVDAKGAKMTLYIKEVDYISKQWVQHWGGKGFEMSGHPDDTKQATNPDWHTMDTVFKNLNSRLKNSYGIDPMRTVTNHWFVWCGKNANGDQDFSAQVQLEKNNGIEMDCNYAHYDNGSNQGHFLGSFGTNQGNYTGSGLTMKYADLKGDLIDVYQHFNNVYDQQYMEHDDKEGFFNCFKGLMDRSLDSGVYSFVSVKAHNAEYFFSEQPLMRMLDYANSRHIPVWTEIKFLDFMRAKDEAAFTDVAWKDNALSFNIRSSLPHTSNISYMIPLVYDGKKINGITSNDMNQTYLVRTIKGREYALLTIRPGASHHIAVSYAQAM